MSACFLAEILCGSSVFSWGASEVTGLMHEVLEYAIENGEDLESLETIEYCSLSKPDRRNRKVGYEQVIGVSEGGKKKDFSLAAFFVLFY